MQVKRFFFILILLLGFLPLGFAQDVRPIVRLIYFFPRDRAPQPDIDEKMDKLIKDVQQAYAGTMAGHGFGRKTFRFETDTNGNAVVHHVKGQFTDNHYRNLSYTWDIWEEIDGRFDTSKNIYLTAIDISSEILDRGEACGRGGTGGGAGGKALIPASGHCFNINLTAHELGHAFGLQHDFRGDAKRILDHTSDFMVTSFCAAEWLDAHRAFNPDRPDSDKFPTIKMHPPSFASPPNAIRFRFTVTDPDGLHQVQLLTHENDEYDSLLGCKRSSGTSNRTVEFVTSSLAPKSRYVSLQMIDVHGNLFWSRRYSINVTSLLPRAKAISIPDANLAAAVRREIGNSITTHTMLNLTRIEAPNRRITHLTGLEHTVNLRSLYLSSNNITDVAPLTNLTQLAVLYLDGNNITDVAPLANLTQMTTLSLHGNSITDVTPLTNLTKLRYLYLNANNITDVAPLANLTQMTTLWLGGNNITDIEPLANLTQMGILHLSSNNITDVTPLTGLTRLKWLYLNANNITDVAPLANLTQMTILLLSRNNITDITPLANLTQMTRLNLQANNITDVSPLVGLNLTGTAQNPTGLYLNGNPLSYASIHTYIPAMQARGIKVSFDNVAHPVLLKISGDTQEGLAGKSLTSPLIVEVQDERGRLKSNVTVTFAIDTGEGALTPTNTKTDAEGKARTFLILGWTPGTTTIRATATGIKSHIRFTATATVLTDRRAEDVNSDGTVDVEDLVLVASSFGAVPTPDALPDTDVNDDGNINHEDVELVLAALKGAPAAPSLDTQWTVSSLQRWIVEAKQRNVDDVTFQRGIAVLEKLLADLLPKETILLANYPNPFNPETWIPYQLSEPADVVIRIYGVNGVLVRTLGLGHQLAGTYQIRNRAVYWDGRNQLGEPVASGVYFYTLSTGDFTATRKMLIRK